MGHARSIRWGDSGNLHSFPGGAPIAPREGMTPRFSKKFAFFLTSVAVVACGERQGERGGASAWACDGMNVAHGATVRCVQRGIAQSDSALSMQGTGDAPVGATGDTTTDAPSGGSTGDATSGAR